ncbi:MAG: tail fiber domain-containing protein, partial [Christensenellaceae bacterium]
CINGTWAAWQEMMPKSGGSFSGLIKAPQVEANALSVGNNNISTNRIGFPASGGSQVGSDAYGCAGSFSTNGFYVKGLDNTWKPVYASTFSQQSTRKSKKDIKKATEQDARKILDVVVYDFRYKDDDKNMQKGVMAEDVLAQGYDRLVTLDGDGNAFGVDYSRFVPDLIQLVQIQEKEISELKAANTAILKRLEILEGKVK